MRQLSAFAFTAIDETTDSLRNIPDLFRSFLKSRNTPRQETLDDRIARVSRLHITPTKFVGYQDQQVPFAAFGTDLSEETIHGLRFTWSSSDSTKVEIDETGLATFLQPGLARIICRAGTVESSVPVLIRPGQRQLQTDEEWLLDQASLVADSTTITGANLLASLLPSVLDMLLPTAFASGGGTSDNPYDELWTEPRNLVGSPRNRAIESTRLGPLLPEGSNLNFSVPLVSLSGRGRAANITLYYNSRVWTRWGNTVSFDAIKGWPFAGFSLGFGRIVKYGSDPNTKLLLIDADGTRHYLGSGQSSQTNTYQTSDGSHITYVGSATNGGTVYYNDGTRMTISVVNNRLLPTQIKDRNGNYLQIVYRSSADGYHPLAIHQVTDTLGRLIQFKYNTNKELIAIDVPPFATNPATRVQFGYQDKLMKYNFSGLTVENISFNDNLRTLRHIYFQTSGTGYLLSYSDYGMVHEFSMQRQMSFSGGAITDGVESGHGKLNYPSYASG